MDSKQLRIVLVRHGERERSEEWDDAETSLTADGKQQAEALAAFLERRELEPAAYLTSAAKHAIETAQEINKAMKKGALSVDPHVFEALGPDGAGKGFSRVVHEARCNKIAFEPGKTVVIVGHEPWLTLLAGEISRGSAVFKRGGAILFEGSDLKVFTEGRARATALYDAKPIPPPDGVDLAEKLQSKMTVAALLAGFTFAALIEISTGNDLPGIQPKLLKLEFDAVRVAAATMLLTFALSLFVTCIYVFDRLMMPPRYRGGNKELERPERGWRLWQASTYHASFWKDYYARGPVYAHMTWAWKHLFTNALALAVLGFLALLLRSHSSLLVAGCAAVVVVVIAAYVRDRPNLACD